jgi:GNAT superfamily N-acetyltransferase
MTLTLVPDLEFVRYQKEIFPQPKSDFNDLFRQHGMQVRGKPFVLDFKRYHTIEFEGRLVWIVARSIDTGWPLGYACSFWYRDLHFDERVAADDLWFVQPELRRRGIGRVLKTMCHAELKKQGVSRIYETVRASYNHETLMQDLGFDRWGARWMKKL